MPSRTKSGWRVTTPAERARMRKEAARRNRARSKRLDESLSQYATGWKKTTAAGGIKIIYHPKMDGGRESELLLKKIAGNMTGLRLIPNSRKLVNKYGGIGKSSSRKMIWGFADDGRVTMTAIKQAAATEKSALPKLDKNDNIPASAKPLLEKLARMGYSVSYSRNAKKITLEIAVAETASEADDEMAEKSSP